MIYLAQPYTHTWPTVRHARYRAGVDAAAALSRAGVHVFAPIVHGYQIEADGAGSQAAAYWQAIDDAILRICRTVVVLKLPGWMESEGVAHEIGLARELGICVEYVAPQEIENYAAAYREMLAQSANAPTGA